MMLSRPILLASLAVFLTTGVVEDSRANTDAARSAAKKAEAAVARGDYRAAEQSLSSVNCQGNPDCQTLVEFTQAWVYESWSEIPSEQSRNRLARALDLYRRASKASPNNSRILINLAIAARRAGETKTAVRAMWDAIKLNPNEAYQGYLFLGDIWRALEEDKKALHNYELAVKTNPNDGQGHQRLLDYYRKAGQAGKLYKYSIDIRQKLPDVAVTGFEYSIGLLYKTDQNKAGESLVRWTAIQSDLGTLSVSNLARLPSPEDWRMLGLRQLHYVAKRDKEPPSASSLSWWNKNAMRKDAMSRLLRLKATRLIAAAEKAGTKPAERSAAQSIAINYLTAAVDTAPRYEAYLRSSLSRSSNTKIDAAINLVSLHHSIKAGADPQGLSGVSESELSEMTKVLFSGKGGAYAAGQLKDIQRYHTVLGLIYYETRRDKSNGADNATFQLTHALRTAERIARRNPEKYEPLPELRALLATVYQRQGKTQESGRESLTAAIGFLEKDNLKKASAALTSAKQNGANTRSVSTILQGRQAVLTQGAALLKTQPGSKAVSLDPKISWLKNPEALNLPKSFIEGQKFKILADLGNRLSSTSNKALASSINNLALVAASQNKVLTSPTDLKRIQRLETNIKQSFTLTEPIKPIKIEGLKQLSPAKIEKTSWTLPSGQGTLQVQIDPQVLTTNRILLDKNRLKINNKILQKPVLNQ